MKLNKIFYHQDFEEQLSKLSIQLKQKTLKSEQLFLENPFHPSLRLHKLRGKMRHLWSISIDLKYRIVFSFLEDGHVLFYSIGTHAIYEE